MVVGAAALAFGEGAPTTGSRGTDASHVGGWRFGVVRFRCVLLVAYLLENFFLKKRGESDGDGHTFIISNGCLFRTWLGARQWRNETH